METVDLVFVFPTQVDKHGNAMRCGKTADYIDASGTIVLGKVVSTYTESIFDAFVVGAKIAL
tara:strand:- start:45 stop:230 length:186 start_codon:yes stop_codon:yes gene_type:complete